MAARVEERAQLAGFVAHDEHRYRADGGGEVGAGRAHVVVETDADPRAAEDALDLERVMIGVGVPRAGQRAGPLDGRSGPGLQLDLQLAQELTRRDHARTLLTDESVGNHGARTTSRFSQRCIGSP